MNNEQHQIISPANSAGIEKVTFPSLDLVTRPTVPTDAAAYYLNRQPQTLRFWATYQTGPLQPIRIYGRLAWPVEKIRSLILGGK